MTGKQNLGLAYVVATLVLSILLVGGLANNTLAADDGYALLCRGGSNLFHISEIDRSTILEMRFRPGTEAARNRPPGLGQCAWEDRPFRGGEPTTLYFFFRNTSVTHAIDEKGRYLSYYVRGDKSKWGYIMEGIRNKKQLFKVRAKKLKKFQYRERAREKTVLFVTHIGD